MSLMHQSIATISSPQFINLQPLDINPLMSSCQIKVLYLGTNRNGSYISKQVAAEMAKTLRGAPIVGYYKQDKQDFADHGEQMIWDDEGIHFNCLTKPYGFVSPDAKVWFQDFEDQDEFGNSIVRTYLMTTGYLWSGQFEQAGQVLADGGKPQSMELDEKSLEGHWSTNLKENMDFFIINDAIFSKLCILGDDVEPCFEGSAIVAPEVSTSFTLDNNFKHTLFNMMEELKDALKGGSTVAKEKENTSEQVVTDFTVEESTSTVDDNEATIEESSDGVENEITDPETSFKKEDQEDKEKEEEDNSEDDTDDKEEEDDDDKKKYALLEEENNNLKNQINDLNQEITSLREFKKSVENKQKDELIAEFYMLSDEDKQDVIANKEKYSLEEIKSKLAVICFEKKVNFNLEDISENDNTKKEDIDQPITTFNITDQEDSTPEWVKEVENTMNKI